ncbi:MAG: glutamate racemase [Oscillospiraceae bacterium]|nr:glutamate racemase [Oscillospiraceae bacterium]
MDNRAIGVFDSGLGGLTAVRRIRSTLPSENIIYFGDTSRVPYGGRSRETLLKFARQDVRFMRSYDIKAIVVACGTVSTNALTELQEENDLPIIGVVEPACRRALASSRTRRIGVIATAASIRTGAYADAIYRLDPDTEVISQACPLFVPLVENGRYRPGDTVVETVAREYLEPLRESGIDTLILGCTHYPLLMDVIAGLMGPDVALIDTGAEAAAQLKRTLTKLDLLAECRTGDALYCVSDRPEDFSALAGQFLDQPVASAQMVDIERY